MSEMRFVLAQRQGAEIQREEREEAELKSFRLEGSAFPVTR